MPFINKKLHLSGINITEFENEFHELWSDVNDENEASQELIKEVESIEADNYDYQIGKSQFSEKLNEISALTKDELEMEKMGAIFFSTGLIETPEEERNLESEKRLQEIYDEMDRKGLPSSFDARKKGTLPISKIKEIFYKTDELEKATNFSFICT